LDLPAIMEGLSTALGSIDGLRSFAYPPDSVSPPAAVVTLPEVDFDSTMARGSDRLEIVVAVLAGRVSERSAVPLLAGYMSGSGSSSVKAAIEADVTLGGVAHSTRVLTADPRPMTVGSVEYFGAEFNVEVIA
jgi:hypothetical protein